VTLWHVTFVLGSAPHGLRANVHNVDARERVYRNPARYAGNNMSDNFKERGGNGMNGPL
jgi:hypothetical protein